MTYEFTPKGLAMQSEVKQFINDHIYPNEAEYPASTTSSASTVPTDPRQAEGGRAGKGLWNLFLPHLRPGGRAPALQCRLRADKRGVGQGLIRVGGLELRGSRYREHGDLASYGSDAVKQRWLAPLLEGEIRSAFAMTERPSRRRMPPTSRCVSNATATSTSSTGGSGSRRVPGRPCQVLVVMGKTNPSAPGIFSNR